MTFYKKDLKKAFIEDNHLQKRNQNTCNSCMFYSEELGKRCKFVGIGFSSGLCVPIKDPENWGCVYYKNRENF